MSDELKAAMAAYTEEFNSMPVQHPPQPTAPALSIPPHAARIHAKLTPLVDRLRVKLAEIPEEHKRWGLRMAQIWPLCSGRQRLKAPAHEVGAALRELGWIRYRCYSDSEPSATYWLPPSTDLVQAKRAIRGDKK